MGMMDAQRRMCKQAFFSDKRLGEHITYNGKDVVALVYIGASQSRADWNDSATAVESASIVDLAYFAICDDTEDPNGIEKPVEGDEIIYKGDRYAVSQMMEHDVAGSHYLVLASKAEKAWGR